MLSVDNLATLLEHFTYQPGWAFRVAQRHDGIHLWISFEVADARNPGVQTQCVETFVPPHRSAPEFYRWLHWRLCRIAIHEVDEFFVVDGQRLYDPHR